MGVRIVGCSLLRRRCSAYRYACRAAHCAASSSGSCASAVDAASVVGAIDEVVDQTEALWLRLLAAASSAEDEEAASALPFASPSAPVEGGAGWPWATPWLWLWFVNWASDEGALGSDEDESGAAACALEGSRLLSRDSTSWSTS